MRLKRVRLVKFKRFDDLTIELGDQPKKVVALVGPNGSGKSAIFDAFEQHLRNFVGASRNEPPWFYSKALFDETNPVQDYNANQAVSVEMADGRERLSAKAFYVRSPYRFTAELRITAIQAKGDPLTEPTPGSSIALDQRLQGNYERMHGRLMSAFYKGEQTGREFRAEVIDRINQRLAKVLEIQISDLGDPTEGRGQLYFNKGTSKSFPFENLSAGEKEVVDILIDLEIKTPVFNDTVYAIDEPELHLSTGIQRKLLKEFVSLVPDTCQLWVATHSIGFLRALQQDLADDAQILDFAEKDYFIGTQTMRPIAPTRANWKRIFSTALEDLTGLLAPQTVMYCEGKALPAAGGAEEGLDARVYNRVFESEFPDVLFVSSGGGGAQTKNSELALRILAKAFDAVNLRLLKDRDERTVAERRAFLDASPNNRMLQRRELENYLLDFDVLAAFSQANGQVLDRGAYDGLVPDPVQSDLKPVSQRLKNLCGDRGSVESFKAALSSYIKPGMAIYEDLKASIFP